MHFQEIDQYHKEPIPVMLLGNKADKTEVKQVPYKKGQQVGTCLRNNIEFKHLHVCT